MTENDRNDRNDDDKIDNEPPLAPPPPNRHQQTNKQRRNEGVPKKDEEDDEKVDVKTKKNESKDGKSGRGSNDDDDDDSDDGIPKDVGYSWVVCFSVSVLQMLVFGHNRALSTSFVDIREEFQQSQTVTSLTLSLFALSLAISSMLASNVIIKMFPPRVSCVCASVCSVISVFVGSQAPHIGVWLASYAVRGLSCGILLIIPMSLIGYYFKERRALASSIASMGMVVGNIAFPPLATVLIETFGLRGALLLLVGIELQMIPISMLLRPHTSYTKRHKQREKRLTTTTTTNNINSNHNNGTRAQYLQPSQPHPQRLDRDAEEEAAAIELYYYSSSAPAIANAHLDLDTITDTYPSTQQGDYPNHNNTSSSPPNTNENPTTDCDTDNHSNGNHDQRKPLLSPMRTLSHDETSGSNNLENPDGNRSPSSHNNNNFLSSPNAFRKRYRLHPEHSRSSHHSSQMSIAALGSLVNVSCVMVDGEVEGKKEKGRGGKGGKGEEESDDSGVDDGDDTDDYDDDTDDEESDKKPTFKQVCRISSFFDVSLWKSWIFRMLAMFMATSGGAILLIIYMPVLATEAGLTRVQGSLLLTIGASVDLVTRPFIGWLADKNIVSKQKMITFSLVAVSVLTQFGRFYTTFPLFAMFTALACLFAGFRANLFHAVVFDYFGPVRAPKVFAMALVCTTVFMAANHPIFGALIDKTGSHVIPLHYVGGVVGVSALVMMFQPVFARLDRQREKKEKEKKKAARSTERNRTMA